MFELSKVPTFFCPARSSLRFLFYWLLPGCDVFLYPTSHAVVIVALRHLVGYMANLLDRVRRSDKQVGDLAHRQIVGTVAKHDDPVGADLLLQPLYSACLRHAFCHHLKKSHLRVEDVAIISHLAFQPAFGFVVHISHLLIVAGYKNEHRMLLFGYRH